MPLNKAGPQTIQSQLYDYICDIIQKEEFSAHEKIPSENELSARFSISRTTVRAVLSRLVSEQILYRVAGKGTFVAEKKIDAVTIGQKGMREQLEEMDYETDTVLLSKEETVAGKYVASMLGIKPDDTVYKISRIRYANAVPLSIHTNYLPKKLFPGIINQDIEKTPLCDIQKNVYGITAKRGFETLESTVATSQEAFQLGVAKGFQFLLLGCTLYTEDNLPFEYSKVIFRGDRIRLEVCVDRV